MMAFSKKILIIDDSLTNIVLLQAVLSRNGYETFTALGANEAYSKIENDKPNLILLDLNMPEISGFDFLSQIKSKEDTKHIPVMVVSATADAVNISRIKALGAIDFIKKPVDLQTIIEKVSRILS